MRALSIDVENKELKEINIEIQANSVYSFFSSISIDDFQIINKHIIYSDANALEQNKKPYFIGSQLVLGDSLILGYENMVDGEATIPSNELETLINYDVSEFYVDALNLLSKTEVNIYSMFELEHNGEKLELNCEWLLYTFNIADDKTKKYFLDELQKVILSKDNVKEFIEKISKLALNAIS